MWFRKLGLITIVSIYLLVLAGGIVRSTGSGMGCPDWPKCFGMWVPPTEVSQLPPNYQEIYAEKLHGEVEFNPVKTWIEYVNRLVGAFTGIIVFGVFVASFSYRKRDKALIFLSFLSNSVIMKESVSSNSAVLPFSLRRCFTGAKASKPYCN